ncbi:hypothetical protein AYO22_09855 [Fonsecaea multimorphosa]|nr:hypothetical protein AYO22_09855 [Fonsecaea multimorphosa]
MAERVKAEIKRGADCRRSRQTTQVTTGGTGVRDFILESGQSAVDKTSRPLQPQVPSGYSQITRPASGKESERAQWAASILGFLDEYEQVDDHLPMLARGRDFDVDFLAKYLDYVFPLLFPFYRPRLHETGRSWVLALFRRSRLAYHSAMSLGTYFFIFTLIDAYPGQHSSCKSQLWEKVGKQIDTCFEMIQHDVHDLRLRGRHSPLIDRARVMESITQFLIFEAALGRSANWNLHLTPALALFEEMWLTTAGSESKLLAALDAIDVPLQPLQFGLKPGSGYVWSPEQAGFRFFTGLLVFIDIVASTALEQPPRLLEYHSDLLDPHDLGEPEFGTVPLQLSAIMGCQNWVLLVISQISVLDAWKKEMKKAERLSMTELLDRENEISRALNDGMSNLDKSTSDAGKNPLLNSRPYLTGGSSTSSRPSTTTTQIWAYAARVYLTVVVSGWHPSNAGIRSDVSRILELLRTINCPDHLRTLAWPLCVAGCMSGAGEQEQEFRHLLATMDDLGLVGALAEVRKIMERVWESRNLLDSETWDIAACLRVLGVPALLV